MRSDVTPALSAVCRELWLEFLPEAWVGIAMRLRTCHSTISFLRGPGVVAEVRYTPLKCIYIRVPEADLWSLEGS